MIAVKKPLFSPGQVVATPGAIAALERTGQSIWKFISHHLSGDWGEVGPVDSAANDEALTDGGRLLSAYSLADDKQTKIWVITEAEDERGNRAATTALLPDEY